MTAETVGNGSQTKQERERERERDKKYINKKEREQHLPGYCQ